MNEFNAAVGLLRLQHIDTAIEQRKTIDAAYREGLVDIQGFSCHNPPEFMRSNCSYFLIFVEDDYPLTHDQLYKKLKANRIDGRRYFYPLIAELPMNWDMESVNSTNVALAEDAAERAICLPIYPELSGEETDRLIEALRGIQN